jgi:hypothetical protein
MGMLLWGILQLAALLNQETGGYWFHSVRSDYKTTASENLEPEDSVGDIPIFALDALISCL